MVQPQSVNYVTSSRDPTLVEANVENYLCTAHAGPLSSSRYEVSTHIDWPILGHRWVDLHVIEWSKHSEKQKIDKVAELAIQTLAERKGE